MFSGVIPAYYDFVLTKINEDGKQKCLGCKSDVVKKHCHSN